MRALGRQRDGRSREETPRDLQASRERTGASRRGSQASRPGGASGDVTAWVSGVSSREPGHGSGPDRRGPGPGRGASVRGGGPGGRGGAQELDRGPFRGGGALFAKRVGAVRDNSPKDDPGEADREVANACRVHIYPTRGWMHVECTACHARYVISDEKIPIQGARVRCRKCQAVFSIERSASPAAPPTPTDLPLIPPTPQAAFPAPPASAESLAESSLFGPGVPQAEPSPFGGP